jgi:Tfp pilus assembly protein PilN
VNLPIDRLQPIEINLLQKEELYEKRRKRLFPTLLLLTVLLGTACTAWMWIDAKRGLSEAQQELAAVQKQVEAVSLKLADSPSSAGLSEFLPLYEQVRNAIPYSVDILDKLAALVPEESNLGALSFEQNQSIKVTGLFSTTEGLISFMQALKADPSFTFVGMSGITKVQPVKRDATNHTEAGLAAVQVTFDLKYNGNLPPKKG